MLKIPSTLPDDTDELITRVIGCCITVHRTLGPGLLEGVYSRAVALELKHAGIQFEREKQIPVLYRGEMLCDQRLDFVIANQIVLEIKAVDYITQIHGSQVLCYLRLSGIRAGLLINFNVPILQDGIKRVVL